MNLTFLFTIYYKLKVVRIQGNTQLSFYFGLLQRCWTKFIADNVYRCFSDVINCTFYVYIWI